MATKRVKTRANRCMQGSSSHAPNPQDDQNQQITRFVNNPAAKRYEKLIKRSIIRERGFEYQDTPFERDLGYEVIRGEIARRQWQKFCDAEHVGKANQNIVCEFFANYPYKGGNNTVYVRGVSVSVTVESINKFFSLPTLSADQDERRIALDREVLSDVAIAQELGQEGTRFHVEGNQNQKFLYWWQLNPEARAWTYFVNSRILPTSHTSSLDYERCVIVYAIMARMTFDIGWVILRNINHFAEMKTTAGPVHSALITALCLQQGVPGIEGDVLKAPMQTISRRIYYDFPLASLEPPEEARKRQKGDADVEEEDVAGAGTSASVPPMSHPEPPLDTHTQGTHDRLDHLIRQNHYLVQSNQYLVHAHQTQAAYYNAYLEQQHHFAQRQVQELNYAFSRWTMNSEDADHFSQPPPWQPYQPPPPPPPY
ncbi:hypothetical protein CsatB_016769 [Cannabis sativa]